MVIPGRLFTGTSGYRYGFNGKEMDNDTYGQGNEYDYGFRIYNPRIGRFLSVDPLQAKYASLTSYQFASNSPIGAVDVDGLEAYAINRNDPNDVKTGPLNLKLFPNSEWIVGTGTPPTTKELIFGTLSSNDKLSRPALTNSNHSEAPPMAIQQQMVRANNTIHPPTPPKVLNRASLQATNIRSLYTDFEWGMITSPATQASIGLMVPGYNFTIGVYTTYQGIQAHDNWQTGIGILGMAGGSFEIYGRFFGTSPSGIQLENLEFESGGHFLSRHGAGTSLSSQYMRAISGLTPDGEVLGEVNASRFLTDDLQLKAVKMAQAQFSATGKTSFTFDMEETIGEGFLKNAGPNSYRTTSQVQAVFQNGKLITLYPLLAR